MHEKFTGRFIYLFEETSVIEITSPGGSPGPIMFEEVRFKMFSVHKKTLSRRFQIPLV